MQVKKKIDKLFEGLTLVFVGAVMLLILLGAFGKGGAVVSNFLVGSLGYAVYGYALAMLVSGVLLLFDFKFYKRIAVLLGALLVFVSFISIFHILASQGGNIAGYGSYIKACYSGRNTCGGAVGAVFLYPIIKLNYIFAIVVFSILAVAGVLFGTMAEIKRNKGGTFRFNNGKAKPVRENIVDKTPVGDIVDLSRINSSISTTASTSTIDNKYVKPSAKASNYNVSTLDETFGRKQAAAAREAITASAINAVNPTVVDETANAIGILFNQENDYAHEHVGEKEVREYTPNEAADILYNPANNVIPVQSPKKKKKVDFPGIENYTNNGMARIIKENMETRGEVTIAQTVSSEPPTPHEQSGIVINSFNSSAAGNKDGGSSAVDNNIKVGENSVPHTDSGQANVNMGNKAAVNASSDNNQNSNHSQSNASTADKDNNAVQQDNTTDTTGQSSGKYAYLNDNIEDMTASNREPLESFEGVIRHNAQAKQHSKQSARAAETEEYRARLERKRRERSDKGGEHITRGESEIGSSEGDELFGQMGGGINLNIQPTMPNKPALTPYEQSKNLTNNTANNTADKSNVSGQAASNEFKTPQTNNDIPQNGPIAQPKFAIKPDAPYKAPPISLLSSAFDNPPSELEDFSSRVLMLEETLESFRLPAKVNNIVRGPAFSRMELVMPPGIAVDRVKQYINDIAMCLETTSVNLQIPIPGKKAFGVELPNKIVSPVGIKSIINSPQFNNSKAAVICALGKDIDGNIHVVDLATMPHLLVAGSTGSGKSVCLNTMLVSIIYHHTPEDVRIALVDPKQVEFSAFNKLPHLLLAQSIYQKDHVLNLMDYLISEMEARYALLDTVNLRKISEYNAYAVANNKEKMYYIVAVLDEVGDLMNIFKKELEERIQRLAAKARAAGIILVLATQRPSVNVITGVIKANLPSRIAFATTSVVDSRTILDQGGANNLLGKGDMLFMRSGGSGIQRIQCAFIDTDEVNAVCDYVRDNNTSHYDPDIAELVFKSKKVANDNTTDALGNNCGDPDVDSTFVKCLLTCIQQGFASISLLQRKYKIGYNRASVYFYKMEEMGYISTDVVNNRRSVILTLEEFEIIYGDFMLD